MRTREQEARLQSIRNLVDAPGWNAADCDLAFMWEMLVMAESPQPVAYQTETDPTVRHMWTAV